MRGSCLCGAVAWEATSPLEALHHCHCSRCRKHHGAPFSTFGQFKRDCFRFTRGEDRIDTARVLRRRMHRAVEEFSRGCVGALAFVPET